MKITLDKVVEAYTTTRQEIKELEDQISTLKALQTKREEYLNQQLTELGCDNVKTAHGTAYTTIQESVTVADAERFFTYVRDTGAWELMEKRASKTAVLQMMGEREEGGRPYPPAPGLNYVAIRKVNVRK